MSTTGLRKEKGFFFNQEQIYKSVLTINIDSLGKKILDICNIRMILQL